MTTNELLGLGDTRLKVLRKNLDLEDDDSFNRAVANVEAGLTATTSKGRTLTPEERSRLIMEAKEQDELKGVFLASNRFIICVRYY